MTEYARNNIIIEFFAKLFQHILLNGKFYLPLHSLNRGNKSGEVVEWSITAVLKTVELRGSGGSNPSLSARNNMKEADSKGQLFFIYLPARSLFVTAFEGKERDAIDVAVSPSECSFVHLVESQCAEKQLFG